MYNFKISEIIPHPNSNISIRFEDLSNDFPKYKAGQFLTLSFTFGEREVRRSYSFSSSPDVNEPYEITVKRVDNGEISRLLHHQMQVGDIIEVMEPQGLFVYEPNEDKQRTIFLFGAGVGITPLYSILKTVLVTEANSKIVLVYSNSSKEKTIFYDELLEWQANYPDRLHIEWIWSNTKNLLKARLNRDYILELVKKYNSGGAEDLFYTCGPLFYMDLCRFTLLGMGIPDDHIKRETFHFPEEEEDEDEKDEEPVDMTSYDIVIRFKGEDHLLTVPYDRSVLDVGLAHKLKLPYSCKSGMCSTCISQVTQGSVRMDYNEVLTDREVENGRCLICTAHPMENNTIIEIL
ncbi:2Fe-2S iron-sulfur cluster binding domain-containing protein [Sphingobacterium sp. DK4209]|uniref:2Fe-2S iron-sulfur cluster binding domain-containing protein n=1 Tax=Sphingobacterium zhuxiongii TaxID=2662364 RepID=A0A5Q0Q9R8_9SPHI|nr:MULTISPECIES: ferredoxin--NADP reductase [unclassified Sphingobacterium]MVZ67082.1 2Fe-2S iron-sulfur cluster binding domain-containing protein [Sphingobacterium sp. DK4209]QGA26847.1 2Fe-2S iron-sulfur cluster binding domain-containing protein [Sphingobacterium sp. dk4302]